MEKSVSYVQNLNSSAKGSDVHMDPLQMVLAEKQLMEDAFLRMRAAVTYSLNGIAIADMEGILNYANDAFVRLWGYEDVSEILGQSSLGFWESLEEAQEVFCRVREDGFWSGKMSGLRKDGTRFTARVSTSLFTDSLGRPGGIMASFWDLKAEDLLAENERRYRELFEHISSGVAIYEAVDDGRDFIFKDINPAGERISKVLRREILGKGLLEVFPGADDMGLFDALRRVWKTGSSEYLPAALYRDERFARRVKNQIYKLPSNEIVAVFEDVTEQKRMEDDLRFMAMAVEYASDAIGMSTPEGRHYYQNKAFTELFGEVGEHPLLTSVEDPGSGLEVLNTIKAGNPWRGEIKARDKNGAICDILTRAYAIWDDTGTIQGLVGILTDITAQKRAGVKLREAQQLLEAAVAQSPSGLIIAKGPGLSIELANPASFALHGIDPQNPQAMSILQKYASWRACRPDGSPYSFEDLPLCRALYQGEIVHNKELILEYANEVRHWVNVSAAPVKDDQGNIFAAILIFDDISSQKEAEAERANLQARLAQAEKMESIGRLAGGVAHDFNNMLMVIGGSAEIALQDLGPDHPVRTALTEISQAVARSAEITRQLLAFTRKQPRTPISLDLNEAIQGMVKMLRRLIGEHIELEWRLGEGLWTVFIDPSQVNQLLINLCVNARDAIRGGGRITVETGNMVLDETYCGVHEGLVPGEYVYFVVTDTGAGMDAVTRNSIFEPFFTTKEADKGTGLGMATVFGIVKQNNGFINVYSEPGLGTSVKIFLPRYRGAKKQVEKEAAIGIPGGAGETILFVEDEPSILKMGRRLLGRLGYRVLATCSPGEAIRMAREHDGDIDLLISDMIMPEMNGPELSKHIQALYPKSGVLYMSGYTAENIARHGLLNEGIHFVQKPFSLDFFARKICEVIHETQDAGIE